MSEAEAKPSAVDLATSAGSELKIRSHVGDLDLDALTLVAVVVLPAPLDELAGHEEATALLGFGVSPPDHASLKRAKCDLQVSSTEHKVSSGWTCSQEVTCVEGLLGGGRTFHLQLTSEGERERGGD